MSKKRRNNNTSAEETKVVDEIAELKEMVEIVEEAYDSVKTSDTPDVVEAAETVADPVVEEVVPAPVVEPEPIPEPVKEEAPVSPVYTPMNWVAGKTEKVKQDPAPAKVDAGIELKQEITIKYGTAINQREANEIAKKILARGIVKDVYIVKNGPLYEVQSNAPSYESGVEFVKKLRRTGAFAELNAPIY